MNTFDYEGKQFKISDEELENIFKHNRVIEKGIFKNCPQPRLYDHLLKTQPRFYLPFLKVVAGFELYLLKKEGKNSFKLIFDKEKSFYKNQEEIQLRFYRIKEHVENKDDQSIIENVIKKKCETLENDEYVFDRNIFIFYYKERPDKFFCYSVKDMQNLITSNIQLKRVSLSKLFEAIKAKVSSFAFCEDIKNIFFNLPLPHCYLPPYFFKLLAKRYNTFELSLMKNNDSKTNDANETKLYSFTSAESFYTKIYDVTPVIRDKLLPKFKIGQKYKIEKEINIFENEQDLINNNGERTISFYVYGKLAERPDLRASMITYFPNSNQIKKEEWLINGIPKRTTDGPYEISYNKNGSKFEEKWFPENSKNSDGPLKITYYETGHIKTKEWYDEKSNYTRKNGPSFEAYYDTKENSIKEEKWIKNSVIGNPNRDEPSIITYYKNNQICSQEWANGNNSYIRVPTIVQYYKNGDVKSEINIFGDREFIKNYALVNEDETYDEDEKNFCG